MSVMFLGGTAEDKTVVDICETEILIFKDPVHETLKGLSGVFRPKDIKGNSKRPKGVVIAVSWMSSGWTGIWC